MAKFVNIVKVKVKPEHREEYLKLCDEEPKFDGMISAKYVEIAPNTFTFIGEWKTQEHIVESRPRMISFLDAQGCCFILYACHGNLVGGTSHPGRPEMTKIH